MCSTLENSNLMASTSRNEKKSPYKYTKLADVAICPRCNLYGVVTELVRTHGVTNSGKQHLTFRLRDESLSQGCSFRIHFFLSPDDEVPEVAVGMIMRLHRVKVEEDRYDGETDGRIVSSKDVVLFPGSGTSALEYSTSAKNPTITREDKERVKELQAIFKRDTLFPDDDMDLMDLTLEYSESGRVTIGLREKNLKEKNNEKDSQDALKMQLNPEAGVEKEKNSQREDIDVVLETSCESKNKHQKREETDAVHDSLNSESDPNDLKGFGSPVPKTSVILSQNANVMVNPFNKRFMELGSQSQHFVESFTSRILSVRDDDDTDDTDFDPSEDCLSRNHPSVVNGGLPRERLISSDNTDVQEKTVTHTAPMPVNHVKTRNLFEEEDNFFRADEVATSTQNQKKSSMHHQKVHSLAQIGTSESPAQTCPGFSCAAEDCSRPGPVLLDDDDPALADFDENELVFEGMGDIPAADDEGQTIDRPRLVSIESSEEKRVGFSDLVPFSWPQFSAKVKIISMKPRLKDLQTVGPKNLLSGHCMNCKSYTFYSNLCWTLGDTAGTKKSVCSICKMDGRESFLRLEFRLKLTVKDSWGTDLSLYAVGSHAVEFLGCSAQEYQASDECRKKVIQLLSEALSARTTLIITFMVVNTFLKRKYFICGTKLSSALDS